MYSLRKTKVVIASTLKPVDDTRLYEKIGLSLALSRHYDVHIIGAQGGEAKAATAHPHAKVKRISIKRLALPFSIARKIFNIRPDVLIVSTHELLFVAALYRLMHRKPIIYDVQENYYLNILHTRAFVFLMRPILSGWVRLKELMMAPLIDLFLLAEKGFASELGFAKGKAIVIENKAVVPPGFSRKPSLQTKELLFSGTLDESTGVFEAIDLAAALHAKDESVCLHIIGYCSRPEVLTVIREKVSRYSFIRLSGGDALQPHSEIINAIATAHFGIISYRPSPHINNRMPTKLYEYLAFRLPILIRKDLWWCDLVEKTKSGVGLDFKNPPGYLNWDSDHYYPGGSRNLTYEFDRDRLVEVIDKLVEQSKERTAMTEAKHTSAGSAEL